MMLPMALNCSLPQTEAVKVNVVILNVENYGR